MINLPGGPVLAVIRVRGVAAGGVVAREPLGVGAGTVVVDLLGHVAGGVVGHVGVGPRHVVGGLPDGVHAGIGVLDVAGRVQQRVLEPQVDADLVVVGAPLGIGAGALVDGLGLEVAVGAVREEDARADRVSFGT